MSGITSHDQNFKNLILDYPRQALEFFAAAKGLDLGQGARITPIRQEQLKSRLGDCFRELDVPVLVEWPDGRREALLFALEEETNPARASTCPICVGKRARRWRFMPALDDNQMHEYQARYPQENSKMVGLTERLLNEGLEKGMRQGMQKGRQEGEASLLARQLTRRFGSLDSATEQRLQQASSDDLERWADNILDARTLDEVFSKH